MRPEIAPRDARDRLIVALDMPTVNAARLMVSRIGDAACFYKIGMELVFAGGLDLVAELSREGKRIFLDMKLLDIENTIAGGVRSIAGLGATFTTIHAYPKAMRAAVAARTNGLGLLGVTVLTSLDDSDLRGVGYSESAADLVARRAGDALESGMDGIVCSPAEASAVRRIVGPALAIVTPGVRPAGAALGDQKRVATPGEAIRAGADYVVVGRPVIAADDPGEAADAIVDEIAAALEG